MKIKPLFTQPLAVLAALLLTGCQLANPELDGAKAPDHLIGLFITTEHLDLFDMEGYLEDNIGGLSGGNLQIKGDQKAYEGRLYAEIASPINKFGEEFVFPDTEGISFFIAERINGNDDSYITTIGGEGISNVHSGLHSGDQEEKQTSEGTLFVASDAENEHYFFNPVYQTESGEVYATTGQGVSFSGDRVPGSSYSHKQEETITVTENGESVKKTTEVTLTVEICLVPEKLRLLEMDSENNLLSAQEYAPDQLPEEITPKPQTAYLLLESYQTDIDGTEKITRKVYSHEEESLESFYEIENGIISQRFTPIRWQ